MMTKLAKPEDTALAVRPSDMLGVIQQIVSDPAIDVAKMQALLDMHTQITAQQQKVAFMEAMARLQAELPQMVKYGKAKNSKFAKLEDIDAVIRPLLAKEGFSFSFDEESHTDKTVTFLALLSHEKGHAESKRLTVPIDTAARNAQGNAIRPAIQDAGSTVSYARRYLIKMHLNIMERDEDTNGESLTAISEDQANDLTTMINDSGSDKARFLKFMGVEKLSDILLRDYPKALNALNEKLRSVK